MTTTMATTTPQNNGINEPKLYSARVFHIVEHFFAVLCKTTWAHDNKFLFRFLCFKPVHSKFGPGQLIRIFSR